MTCVHPRSARVGAAEWVRVLAVLSLAPIHPALMERALQTQAPVRAWVVFRDKGVRGTERTLALARAEASLTPRARARRERAGVWPIVDDYDLPVHDRYLQSLRAMGFAPHAVSRWLNRAAVFADRRQLSALASLPFVGSLEPVRSALRSPEPDAPDIQPESTAPGVTTSDPSLYGPSFSQLVQLNLPALHDSGYTGAGVLVCILDDGFTYHDTHEALIGASIPPGHRRDFVDGDTTVTTSGSALRHGTMVMSCIAGNKPGTYLGGAYGATFALGRTENDFSETQVEMLYWGMGAEWADSLGADIITSSLGYSVFDAAPSYVYADMDGHTTDVSRAAQVAVSKGMLVVNAAGNQGNKSWHYIIAPADVNGDSLIAAAAVDAAGTPAPFSSWGPSADGRIKPDLAARGVGVWMASTSGDPTTYTTANGTSFATPLLTSLAACLMQARPSWSPVTLIRALRETASKALTPDNRVGYGVPNGIAALHWPNVPVATPESGWPSLSLRGPNPLRLGGAQASISFTLLDGTETRISVHDALGRQIATLWRGRGAAGHEIVVDWDGRDDEARQVRPGIYWIVMSADRTRHWARLAVLR